MADPFLMNGLMKIDLSTSQTVHQNRIPIIGGTKPQGGSIAICSMAIQKFFVNGTGKRGGDLWSQRLALRPQLWLIEA